MKIVLQTCNPAQAASLLFPRLNSIVDNYAHLRDPKLPGGWFAFWRLTLPTGIQAPLVGFALGDYVSADRILRYQYRANEKAARLYENPSHCSSWQSRDESDPDPWKRKYGGAVRCQESIVFSCAGFPEHWDEFFCTVVGQSLDLISDDMVLRIITTSKNKMLAKYFATLMSPELLSAIGQ